MKHRKHGTGTLILRGGKWFARWVYIGKQYEKTTGTANRKEAEKRLKELLADFQREQKDERATLRRQIARLGSVEEQIRQAEDAKPALAIVDAWEAYEGSMKRKPVSAVTFTRYRQRFEIWEEWHRRHFPEATEVRSVTAEHAEAFMRNIAASKSAKTFNDYRSLLSQIWRILAKDERARLAGDPWAAIERREQDTHSRRELTVDELGRVAALVSGEMRVLFAVGLYTGLRLGDAVSLDWGAVDLVRGFIDGTPHKTKKHGTRVHIPIADALRAVLEETPPSKRHGPLVPGLLAEYHSGATEGATLCKHIQKVFRSAGIEVAGEKNGARAGILVGFHSLRHTFVSLCANSGVPLAVVQSIVGHTNVSMTRHYFHVSDTALQGATVALPDVVTVEAETVEIEDAPKQAAGTRTRALPGPGAADVPANGTDAPTGDLAAIAEILARMDAAGLAEVARMVAAAQAGAGKREGAA